MKEKIRKRLRTPPLTGFKTLLGFERRLLTGFQNPNRDSNPVRVANP
jgi:hypothetical protein